MKNKIKVSTTSFIDRVYIQNSTTGAPLTGLAYNTAGLTFYYIKIFDTSATAVTLANCTLGTYTSGGFKEVDATNLPGLYEIHYPNAMLSSATKVHAILKGASNMQAVPIEIELDAVNYQSATNFGLSCLPTANPGSANGLLRMGSSSSGDVSVLSGVVACSVASGGIASGSFGSGAITAAAFAANALGAVWDEARSGHTTSGTFGAYVLANTASDAAIAPASTALSTATWTGTRAGYLDNLSAGAVATASALSTAAGNITTILGQTGTTGVVIASGAITASTIASDAITAAKIATGAITSAKFAAGAIDAAAIATGAIDADALAADAVTEIWAVAVPGSFSSGSAAYVLGNIATGTPPTAAAIADAVWDEARTGHTTSGTFGYYLDSAISGVSGGGGATAADIADAVWDELISGHATSGSFAAAVTTDQASLSTLLSRLSSTRAGNLDYLDAAITSTASGSALSSVASNVTTILGQTGTTGVVVAAGSKSGYALSSSGLDAVVVETGVNARQALSVIAAAGGGVLAGAGTGTITIKGANVATTRITATTDSSGNRSSITLSLPS